MAAEAVAVPQADSPASAPPTPADAGRHSVSVGLGLHAGAAALLDEDPTARAHVGIRLKWMPTDSAPDDGFRWRWRDIAARSGLACGMLLRERFGRPDWTTGIDVDLGGGIHLQTGAAWLRRDGGLDAIPYVGIGF